ncbi:hypothetical protein Ms3S1_07270 [Methylosinus sp. 3S-1]
MSNIADHRKWLKENTLGSLTQFSKWRKGIKIGLVAGGALIAGVTGASANLVEISHKWLLYSFQIFGGVLVFIGGCVLEAVDEGAADAIKRADELADLVDVREQQIAELGVDFEWFTHLYSTASALREVVEGASVAAAGAEDERRPQFATMLDIIASEKDILFGMNADRWNFAVYIFSVNDGLLKCVACRRPIRAEEDAPHRSWKPGEGHVGIAFQTQREIVASDTSEPEARALFDGPDPSRREEDRARYRSIASIPIKVAGADAVGVVVATSDVAGRFWIRQREDETARDPVEPLRNLANALAMVIKITDLQTDEQRRSSHE